MESGFGGQKPITEARIAVPYQWWSVDDVAVGPQLTLYYRLGERRPLRDDDGHWLRDERGRVALEAFGALPLPSMYERFRAHRDSLKGREDVEPEQAPMLECLGELVGFVRTFGPLGFNWARTFEVRNPDADRARSVLAEPGRWQVRLPALGEVGLPRVSQLRAHPELPWETRVRWEDDALPQDFLGPLPGGPLCWQQENLHAALRLTNALADGHRDGVRDALRRIPGYGTFRVRDSADRAPVDIDWRDAMRTPGAPASGWWAPFEVHPGQVDWIAAGHLWLATFLSAQLAWTRVAIGLDAQARFRSRWIVGSLMEVIYLQLVEHVERRLGFGVGWCGYCGGPILRVRQKQRWHRKCANAGRVQRHRRSRGGKTDGAS